jgi:hypothetical protein
MTLGFAAGVSCELAMGHHLQAYVCESQTARGVVRSALDVSAAEYGRHALLGSIPAIHRRVPHISLVFREMWDTVALSLKPLTDSTTPYGCPTFAPAYVGRKRWAKPNHGFHSRPYALFLTRPGCSGQDPLRGKVQVSKAKPGRPTQRHCNGRGDRSRRRLGVLEPSN